MGIRIVVFKQGKHNEEPIGTKPKLVQDIIEFEPQDHILKNGNFRSFIRSFLIENFEKVSSGKIDENEIYTMAIEHVDD